MWPKYFLQQNLLRRLREALVYTDIADFIAALEIRI